MLRELYLHPNGQLPAYEWNFSDVNPPVHAWATLLVYETELEQRGEGDVAWLKSAFQKLLVNFTWWINRKDPTGRNVFEGGFLGLDNIGVFDRSAPLPTGGHLEQSDGTAWMAFFSQCMLGIALELSQHDPLYEDMVAQVRRALRRSSPRRWTASATTTTSCGTRRTGSSTTCCACPTARARRLKVRSIVGLLPLCATHDPRRSRASSSATSCWPRLRRRIEAMPELLATIHDARRPGVNGRRMLAVLDETKLRRILARMLDEDEFLSPHGLRALSRYHAEHPFSFDVHGQTYEVHYLPAESDTGMFGGNSNWRGPVWFPINYLVLRGLLHLYAYYGDDFTVECPTGSGQQCTLFEVAHRAGPAADVDLPARRRRPPAGVRRHRAVPDRPELEGPAAVLRVLPRRQRRRARRQPPDRVDRAGGPRHPGASGTSTPRTCCRTRSTGTSCTGRRRRERLAGASRRSTSSTPRPGCTTSVAAPGAPDPRPTYPPPSGTV